MPANPTGSRRKTEIVKPKTVCQSPGKPFYTGTCLVGARWLRVRAVLLVSLRMVRLRMVSHRGVPHGGVPAVVRHVSERHRRGSERGYDENSKSFLENEFHGNPERNKGVSTKSAMQCLPSATAMRRHINAVTD
jgi:hypothetical protein